MQGLKKIIVGFAACCAESVLAQQAVSENDYLQEVPVVLSVSRLTQPIDDAPGAVTILDQEFIRASGARSLADLLRLVPGFQASTSYETDVSTASYHGHVDDYSNRMQVLVNGRSVYFGNLEGSIGLGLQQMDLRDIERIEILRGSNSAAYGARAFMGVVSIYTHSPVNGPHNQASIAVGNNGIADAYGRLSWGDAQAVYEISLSSQQDDGLINAFAKPRSRRVNAAAQWNLEDLGSLEWRLGALQLEAAVGSYTNPLDYGNPKRNRDFSSANSLLNWQKTLSQDEDIAIQYSRSYFAMNERYAYLDPTSVYYGWIVDHSSQEMNDALSFQYTRRWSQQLRWVLGIEHRQEVDTSDTIYSLSDGGINAKFERLYASAEWRFYTDWLLNAGGMFERSTLGGDSFSPRLMVNWHLDSNQTLRAGATKAFRTPSAFEKYGNVRYWDPTHTNQTILFTQNDGTLGSEHLWVRELGYSGNWSSRGLSLDARLFSEQLRDGILANEQTPNTYFGQEAFDISGFEYQLQWKASPSTDIFQSASWTQIDQLQSIRTLRPYRTTHSAPSFASSMMVTHRWGDGFTGSVIYNNWQNLALLESRDEQPYFSAERWDVRLARAFSLQQHKAEWSITVQNLADNFRDGSRPYFFPRQVFVSLTFDL